MNQQRELKLLKQVEIAAVDTKSELRKLRILVWSFRVAGLFGVFIGVFLMKTSSITTLVGGIISAAGGLSMGLSLYFKIALEQTPVLMRYIDIESVRKRIHEIRT